MRAMQLVRPAAVARGPLEPTERDDPRAGEGELLLRVAACGVCRTDLQICEGDIAARRLPIVPGHQIV
jgi:propanol-preferring alcohol dehydrogenase